MEKMELLQQLGDHLTQRLNEAKVKREQANLELSNLCKDVWGLERMIRIVEGLVERDHSGMRRIHVPTVEHE